MPTILAIESSCDDTAAAVIKDGKILSNFVSVQLVHEQYGGVVPEVASRAHQVNIVPVVDQALKSAGISTTQLDAVAFTRGPGLMGSLIVGVSFAKALGLSLQIPIIEVNHMQAHILAHFIDDPKPTFPFLCLTVSGGHTQIWKVNAPLHMDLLGQTLDDAAGEAFDKTGKMLGLGYPAGPTVDRLAQNGFPRFDFPEPRIPGLDFSFSGLKTAILYFLTAEQKKNPLFIADNMEDICASIQHRIVSILINKLILASEQSGIREIAIAGGVSANSGLRSMLHQTGIEKNWNVFIPAFEYCTDNAAMVAMAAAFKFEKADFAPLNIAPTTV